MEVLRKPEQTPTATITVRVEVPVKKELAQAREIAARQNIDMTAMVSRALSEVAKAILNANTSKRAPLSSNGSATS